MEWLQLCKPPGGCSPYQCCVLYREFLPWEYCQQQWSWGAQSVRREKERDNERTWRDKQEKWKTSSGSKFKTDGHLLGPDQNGCPVVVLRSGGNACSSCAMVSWYRSWKRRRAHSIHSSNVFGLFSPTAETSTCKVKSCRRPEIVMIVLILGHILTGSLPSSFNVLSTKAGSLHNKQQYSIDSRE